MKKAISRAVSPADGLLELSSYWPSSGAGYDDLDNNNAYRNNAGVG